MQFLLIFLGDSRFCTFSSNFSQFFPEFRRISMISERVMSRFSHFREIWEILLKFCKILMRNCWKSVRKKWILQIPTAVIITAQLLRSRQWATRSTRRSSASSRKWTTSRRTARLAAQLESFGLFLHQNQHLTLFFLHQQRDLVELCFKHLWPKENFVDFEELWSKSWPIMPMFLPD